MKNHENKVRYVELKTKGLSEKAISQEIGVSPPTLRKWRFEFRDEIEEAQKTQLESVLIKYHAREIDQVEQAAQLLTQIREEIERRSMEELELKDLYSMEYKLKELITEKTKGIRFKDGFKKVPLQLRGDD